MRHILTFVAALVALLIPAAPVFAQTDLDCADFDSQDQAQAELDSDPSDPHRLDRDNDGEACETFDYPATSGESGDSGDESTSADFPAPERANLGGGGAAGGVDPFLVFAAATGALVSFGGAVYLARRRR